MPDAVAFFLIPRLQTPLDVEGRILEVDFWRVVREPIRLRDTIAQLERAGTYRYVDLGAAGTLATFVKYALPPGSRSTTHAILTPYGHDIRNLTALMADSAGIRC